jgi:hypothetical protein
LGTQPDLKALCGSGRFVLQEAFMGLLDDAVPGGSITKPLLVALGVLLA